MTRTPLAMLLVRAGRRQVALTLEHLVEVVDPGMPIGVPARQPALRGLTTVRGQLVPLVHLGALLDGGACPAAVGDAGVVIAVGDRRICLEVEAVEEVVREPALPVPAGETLPWALGVTRASGGLVPVLDIPALGGRLVEGGS
ncbi:MAG TPA: chemotaxis protein CheW [Gemmatimonadales bacterium]|nr:chemotaxis protein CheW [Gemmatimonadales bacterium]